MWLCGWQIPMMMKSMKHKRNTCVDEEKKSNFLDRNSYSNWICFYSPLFVGFYLHSHWTFSSILHSHGVIVNIGLNKNQHISALAHYHKQKPSICSHTEISSSEMRSINRLLGLQKYKTRLPIFTQIQFNVHNILYELYVYGANRFIVILDMNNFVPFLYHARYFIDSTLIAFWLAWQFQCAWKKNCFCFMFVLVSVHTYITSMYPTSLDLKWLWDASEQTIDTLIQCDDYDYYAAFASS